MSAFKTLSWNLDLGSLGRDIELSPGTDLPLSRLCLAHVKQFFSCFHLKLSASSHEVEGRDTNYTEFCYIWLFQILNLLLKEHECDVMIL